MGSTHRDPSGCRVANPSEAQPRAMAQRLRGRMRCFPNLPAGRIPPRPQLLKTAGWIDVKSVAVLKKVPTWVTREAEGRSLRRVELAYQKISAVLRQMIHVRSDPNSQGSASDSGIVPKQVPSIPTRSVSEGSSCCTKSLTEVSGREIPVDQHPAGRWSPNGAPPVTDRQMKLILKGAQNRRYWNPFSACNRRFRLHLMGKALVAEL